MSVSVGAPHSPVVPASLLSARASTGRTSAIRDLLEQAQRPGMISLAGGLPDPSLFPLAELAAIAERVVAVDGTTALQYGETRGDARTRSAMASLFSPGKPPDTVAEEIVVTTGSQQALDLLARVLFGSGDIVVVSDPDYLGALQVFRSAGAQLHAVPVDEHGLDVERLADDLRAGLRPKACYVVARFHNPTGATLSSERRQRLDELSDRYGFVVIEDDPYGELYFGDHRPPHEPLNAQLTVQLRSVSKTLAPGLRVGALRAPAWLREPVVIAKQSVDLHTSSLTQAIVAQALAASWLPDHLHRLRAIYGAKRDVLCGALRATFGDQVGFHEPGGGMFVWARFDQVDDSGAWLRRCLDRGVCFVPGTAFAVERNLESHIRLSFTTAGEDDLATAVDRMHAAL